MAIHYCRLDEFWTKHQKFDFINQKQHIGNLEWKVISPDSKYNWLTEGLHSEFDNFIAMGSKEGKADKNKTENVIFKIYSGGVKTNRDIWAYNFNQKMLEENMQKTIDFYNQQVFAWSRNQDKTKTIDEFVTYDDKKLSWSEGLKKKLEQTKFSDFDQNKFRTSLYRPFIKQYLYFDRTFNERVYQFPQIFPNPETEKENLIICVNGIGGNKPPFCLISSKIVDLGFIEATQCFPFYVYDENGNNRQENITDWALETYQKHYYDLQITKKDIFYYVYGLLHAKNYREKYAQNLKKELPRIPFVKDFWLVSTIGKELADLHLNYETADKYALDIETTEPLNWKVEKMRLSKDKKNLVYNESITLQNIPAKTFSYKLGNRSALEWVIEQYRIKTDERSGILNDPNQPDNPKYILDLVMKIITVSLKTTDLMKQLENIEWQR